MKNNFDEFLKNGLSEYDAKYLNDYKYVMMLYKENEIRPYFANFDYAFFIEYPDDNKDYDTPGKVLLEEMNLAGCEAGIIYENMDGSGDFQPIAFIENVNAAETDKNKKTNY